MVLELKVPVFDVELFGREYGVCGPCCGLVGMATPSELKGICMRSSDPPPRYREVRSGAVTRLAEDESRALGRCSNAAASRLVVALRGRLPRCSMPSRCSSSTSATRSPSTPCSVLGHSHRRHSIGLLAGDSYTFSHSTTSTMSFSCSYRPSRFGWHFSNLSSLLPLLTQHRIQVRLPEDGWHIMLRLLGSFLRHPQWRHLVGLGLLDRDLRLESVQGLGLETSVI